MVAVGDVVIVGGGSGAPVVVVVVVSSISIIGTTVVCIYVYMSLLTSNVSSAEQPGCVCSLPSLKS